MWRCEDEQMWRWADVKMSRCEDEQMWRWADVKMRRCEDEKVWRWEGVKMRRCEDEKVWRWEDEIQTPTIGRTLRSDALGKKCIYKIFCILSANAAWMCWHSKWLWYLQKKCLYHKIPSRNQCMFEAAISTVYILILRTCDNALAYWLKPFTH